MILRNNIDMFYTKKYKPEPNQNKNSPKYIFPVQFHNKGLDLIHINKTLKNEEVRSELPKSYKMMKHGLLFTIQVVELVINY